MSTSHRTRGALAVGILVLFGSLAACAPAAPAAVCVPELSVTPDDPRPGRIVTVETTRACPGDLPAGARWEVRIQPEDATIPVARAFVVPDENGSFSVQVTVPPTIGPGRAIAHISNYWDYTSCPDRASCAAAAVTFDVSE